MKKFASKAQIIRIGTIMKGAIKMMAESPKRRAPITIPTRPPKANHQKIVPARGKG
jgi:hypothetical protein